MSGMRYKVKKDEVVHRVIDDDLVLLSLATGHYYSVNLVGALIWQLLECGTTVDAIVDELRKVYDVSDQELRSDITDLLRELKSESLLDSFPGD